MATVQTTVSVCLKVRSMWSLSVWVGDWKNTAKACLMQRDLHSHTVSSNYSLSDLSTNALPLRSDRSFQHLCVKSVSRGVIQNTREAGPPHATVSVQRLPIGKTESGLLFSTKADTA